MYNQRTQDKLEKKTAGTRKRLRLLTIALAGFMGWAGVTFWSQLDRLEAKAAELSVLESKLAAAKKTNEEYKRQIDRLNDPEYIEQRVREDFQMFRPGDTPLMTPEGE